MHMTTAELNAMEQDDRLHIIETLNGYYEKLYSEPSFIPSEKIREEMNMRIQVLRDVYNIFYTPGLTDIDTSVPLLKFTEARIDDREIDNKDDAWFKFTVMARVTRQVVCDDIPALTHYILKFNRPEGLESNALRCRLESANEKRVMWHHRYQSLEKKADLMKEQYDALKEKHGILYGRFEELIKHSQGLETENTALKNYIKKHNLGMEGIKNGSDE